MSEEVGGMVTTSRKDFASRKSRALQLSHVARLLRPTRPFSHRHAPATIGAVRTALKRIAIFVHLPQVSCELLEVGWYLFSGARSWWGISTSPSTHGAHIRSMCHMCGRVFELECSAQAGTASQGQQPSEDANIIVEKHMNDPLEHQRQHTNGLFQGTRRRKPATS